MTRRHRTMFINAALVVLVLAAGAGAYLLIAGSSAGAQTSTSRTVTVSTGDVSSTVSATGNLEAAKQVAANFDTSGTVTSIKVAVGDTVDKGDVLATIDKTQAQADLTSAEASLAAAEAQLDSAESGTTTTDPTTGRSTTTVDASQVASAKAQVTQAQAQVGTARQAVANATLKAPISGTVLEVNGIVGSDASSSAASGSSSSSSSSDFIVIANLKTMKVSVSFSESDISSVKVGKKATITFPAVDGVTASGKVVSIDPNATVSNSVVTYGAVVKISDVPQKVRLGQTADVTITTASAKGVLIVPTLAITTRDDNSIVTVVKDGVETPTAIKTGVEGDSYTEVTSGLSEGDQVVMDLSTSSSSSSTTTNTFGPPATTGTFGGGAP